MCASSASDIQTSRVSIYLLSSLATARTIYTAQAAVPDEVLRQKLAKLDPKLNESNADSRDFYDPRNELRETIREIRRLLDKIWTEIIAGADIICVTCVGSGGLELRSMQFPLVVLDEGSQCSEPEALIPIMRGSRQVVILGDPKQLPPVVQSKEAAEQGLQISLFERLLTARIPSQLLNVQYRMHPVISAFPNAHFYGAELQDGVPAKARPPPDVPLLGFENPVLFIATGSKDAVRDGGSKYNTDQAELVADLVHYLIKNNCSPSDLGVVTPYDAQVDRIQWCLKKKGILVARGVNLDDDKPQVEVKSVDGYQGREKKVIIFSTVRSNLYGGIGFCADKRRLNVAITRARNALILVGDSFTLADDKNEDWNKYIEWLRQRGRIITASKARALLRKRKMRA